MKECANKECFMRHMALAEDIDKNFCRNCGKELSGVEFESPTCGHIVRTGDKFCTLCGTKIEIDEYKQEVKAENDLETIHEL